MADLGELSGVLTADTEANHAGIVRWGGTPQLLAHLASVVARVVAEGSANPPTLEIEVEVQDDRELFHSPADFLAGVTPEALRHFRSISIRSWTRGQGAAVTLRWTRPWWMPGTTSDSVLVVELAGDPAWRDAARVTVNAALARGHVRFTSGAATIIGMLLGGSLLLLMVISVGVLLDFTDFFILGGLAFVLGSIVGAVVGTWVWPSLEVAHIGHTNAWRAARVVGPIALAIALAGLSKQLFG